MPYCLSALLFCGPRDGTAYQYAYIKIPIIDYDGTLLPEGIGNGLGFIYIGPASKAFDLDL